MTFTQQGDRVQLDMTRDDYDELLMILGSGMGAAIAKGDEEMFWRQLRFANALNRTNPNFTPYEIPAQFENSGPSQKPRTEKRGSV